MTGRFELKNIPDNLGRRHYYFVLRDDEKIVLDGESYEDIPAVLNAIEVLRIISQDASRFFQGTADEKAYWSVTAASGQIIGALNPAFSATWRASTFDDWVRVVAAQAPVAPIVYLTSPDANEQASTMHYSSPERLDPHFTIILGWDSDILSAPEYAALVAAIGDLARTEGASGIKRVLTGTVGVDQNVGALT